MDLDTLDNIMSPDDLWAKINDLGKEYEASIFECNRRSLGAYYTDLTLAKHMVDQMFEFCFSQNDPDLESKTFLEPCVGTGNFVFAYLKKIHELGYSRGQALRIFKNIYVADIDAAVLMIYRKLLARFASLYFDIDLDHTYFADRTATGLLFNLNHADIRYLPIQDVFPKVYAQGGFDVILTNPPYKNLKAEKNKYSDDTHYQNDKAAYQKISGFVKKHFSYGRDGVLNLYKLFVEEIICRYSKVNAVISLLIPATLLTDKTCEKLRSLILENHALKHVNILRENNSYMDSQQALCTVLLEKSAVTSSILVNKDYCGNNKGGQLIHLNDIANTHTGNAIFAISASEYKLLRELRAHPVINDLPFITNRRGELDLTIHKNEITPEPTANQLIRGKNLGRYRLNQTPIHEYVRPGFVKKSSKAVWLGRPRIACQQVANIHKERRLTFSYIESGKVLANSCNYLCVDDNEYGLDLYALLGIMNSSLMNWLFKLTSSNNHVNNYELDSLPVPLDAKLLSAVSKLVRELLATGDEALSVEIDKLINGYFKTDPPPAAGNTVTFDGLIARYCQDLQHIIGQRPFTVQDADMVLHDDANIESVLAKLGIELDKFHYDVVLKITEKYKKIKQNQVLNHITFKLSELDLEMVRSVPQGGNWKNIPETVANKSQRVRRITETGGRTTLYGRIDYHKPSYTITTYFNRPGNGAYIHPEHDRVISVREAARLQSFKDDYYFTGNKKDLLKQVGNAVPPLLAYEIAKKIKSQINCETSLDLFCGAGGLTAGFKAAGIKSIAGVDFDRSACITFKVNNPEINVFHDDITKPTVKERLYALAGSANIDMICGGPPCQGFSHAGKRFIDDPRNRLYQDYIEIISRLKPKFVVTENVEGLLTFSRGHIYQEIISLFSGLEYQIEGRKLLASEYGVPQKRKRVIIICVRNDIKITPDQLFPEKTTRQPQDQITAREALVDLAPITCGEHVFYGQPGAASLSDYAKQMRGILKYGSP